VVLCAAGRARYSWFVGDLDLLVIANRIGGAGTIPDLFNSSAIRVKDLSNEQSKTSEASKYCDVKIGAGVVWHQLVEQSLQQGLYGLEHLALIPGLVGGAPIQNIGAYYHH